jgi:hypothetical protein
MVGEELTTAVPVETYLVAALVDVIVISPEAPFVALFLSLTYTVELATVPEEGA